MSEKSNVIGNSSQFGDFALMVLANSTSPEIEEFLLSQSKSTPSHKLRAIARELEKLEKKRELEEYREEIIKLRREMQELSNKGEPFFY